MLNNISWADYISTIITLTILYYLLIGLHYYGRDLLVYIGGRNQGNSNRLTFMEKSPVPSIPDELSAYIEESGHADNETLLSGMRHILKRYDVEESTKINIQSYIKDHCSAHLTDEEMQGIWTR